MNTKNTEHCFLKGPMGWLRIEADKEGVTRIEFLESSPVSVPMIRSPHLKEAYTQLAEYFRGDRINFKLTLNPDGTDFERQVWSALSNIPFGTTASNEDIATRIACPKRASAIGAANFSNPLPILVPCHRIVCTAVGENLSGLTSKTLTRTNLRQHERVNSKPIL